MTPVGVATILILIYLLATSAEFRKFLFMLLMVSVFVWAIGTDIRDLWTAAIKRYELSKQRRKLHSLQRRQPDRKRMQTH